MGKPKRTKGTTAAAARAAAGSSAQVPALMKRAGVERLREGVRDRAGGSETCQGSRVNLTRKRRHAEQLVAAN